MTVPAPVPRKVMLTVPAAATDSDLPAQTLSYSLVAAPAGAAINSTTGVFTWTPGESDGPGTFPVTIRVTALFSQTPGPDAGAVL